MQLLENEIIEVMDHVWRTVLDLKPRVAARIAVSYGFKHGLPGCVQIAGAWCGALTVQRSPQLASIIAARTFGLADEAVTISDIRDALEELVNITGGNIKALLPPTNYLPLPLVVDGHDYVLQLPGSVCVTKVEFECAGEVFQGGLCKWDTPQASSHRAMPYRRAHPALDERIKIGDLADCPDC